MTMSEPCGGCLPVAQRAAGGRVAVEKRRPAFAPTLSKKGGERCAHDFILADGGRIGGFHRRFACIWRGEIGGRADARAAPRKPATVQHIGAASDLSDNFAPARG